LIGAASFHSSPEKVLEEIKNDRLIDAATLLYGESADRFQRLVARSFGTPVSEEQVRTGPVSLLPMIATGPVITTNFDHVLEAAFLAAEAPFDKIVTGQEPDNVIRAMHRNEHVLIKIHGDASDRSARVFTGLEYAKQYGPPGGAEAEAGEARISKLARIMFTNRPLLFLGSSLDRDRTLEVLEALHSELPGLTHYAVLAGSYGVSKTSSRRCKLDKYGISPLWFVPGDFKRIEGILQELLQAASTRLLWKNPKPREALVSQPKESPVIMRSEPGEHRPLPRLAVDDKVGSIVRRLARRIVAGRLAFFLGAGAHLQRALSALDFYRSLAKDYLFNEEDSQRAEVAQFIIDCEGKPEAWAIAKQRIPARGIQASQVYDFLSELPSLLRRSGRDHLARQWFLTTNYDVVLEEALAGRGEEFHLLYYQVDGKDGGRFVHRALDGSIRVIERPQNIRSFSGQAHIVVKLDGGIPWDERVPETVAIAPMDFSISAGRLPTALPRAVCDVIRNRFLLILGSSLKDAHVQRLIRWSTGGTRAVKTWAVQMPVSVTSAQYWSAAGVELVASDLVNFIDDLRNEISSILQAPE